MSRETENKICSFCESQYKLSFDPEDVSGFPKFCTFCGSDWDDIEEMNDDDVGC